jgi:hypothetical protein
MSIKFYFLLWLQGLVIKFRSSFSNYHTTDYESNYIYNAKL